MSDDDYIQFSIIVRISLHYFFQMTKSIDVDDDDMLI